MEIERIKLIIDLTRAKIDILTMKSDEYVWFSYLDSTGRKSLLDALRYIDSQIRLLNDPPNQ